MDNENFNVEFGEVVNIGGGTSDFNQLSNRPKYNNTPMTGATNIPKVPTKTSELNNDSDYQTGTEVESAISTAIAGKQDTLTAGNNITISNNTISATDTTYSAGTGLTLDGTQFSVNTETIATQQDVSNEATARENADTNLQGQIDAISASSDVTDIVGTYADLQAYDTTHLKDNDIIKVLQDESQNDETTYYRWSTSTQTFTLIGEEGPYYTKSQTDTLLQAKQDNLTAGANITIASDNTISATDTTYTAGTNVSISSGNVISATDTTYSDFTGTDGTAAGAAGLVPAPATTDAGKFLGASGLWETVQSGGSSVIELTSADYNWNSVAGDSTTTPFNSVAIGLLDDGVYTCKDNVNIAIHPTPNFPTYTTISIIIVSKDSTSVSVPNRRKVIYLRDDKLYVGTANFIDGTGSSYYYLLDQYSLTNSLTSSSTTTALTANQGKTLKDLIDSLVIKGAGAPTTSTVGTVGKLYEDTTNGDLYICTDATNPYVWEEVGAGGGGPTVVQTIGTSTTDVMSQNAVTKTLFQSNDGNRVKIGNNASTSNRGTSVGTSAQTSGDRAVAVGDSALASGVSSVAVGRGSQATTQGQFDIGDRNGDLGYNNSAYRLLSGVYDGQSAHDAATKGQLDSIAIQNAGAPTTATVGTVGQLLEDTTNGKLYICTDTTGGTYTWEEVGAGGGGGPTVVQTTGTSTTDVMSQNATSSMVFADPSSKTQVQIGNGAKAGANSGNASVAIGNSAKAYQNGGDGSSAIYPTAVGPEAVAKGNRSLALGANSSATYTGSVAVGAGAKATSVGQFDIGTQYGSYGYNSSNYRLLTGLYDGQSAHDAATVAQGNTLSTSAPTTSTVGVLGQLYTDTTNMHTYQCTAISGDTYTWTQRW